jgi:Replication protein C N-terminal domain
MTTRSTTPFGRRSMPLGLIATQIETNAFAVRSATTRELVHKQRAFKTLSETRRFFGVRDRDLTVIRHPLLTFHPDTRSRRKKVFATPYLFAPCGAYSRGRPNNRRKMTEQQLNT